MIVSPVAALIVNACPDEGSVARGYVFVDVLPSIVQVKDNELSAILIAVPTGNV